MYYMLLWFIKEIRIYRYPSTHNMYGILLGNETCASWYTWEKTYDFNYRLIFIRNSLNCPVGL